MSYHTQRLAWTDEEDDYLISAVARYGVKRWAQIAQGLPGRTSKACSHRWRTYLAPGVKHTSDHPFSNWEIAVVQEAHKALGNNWSAIAKMLPGRTNAAVKNFWYAHKRRHQRYLEKIKSNKGISSPSESQSEDSQSSESADVEVTPPISNVKNGDKPEGVPSPGERSAGGSNSDGSSDFPNAMGKSPTFSSSTHAAWQDIPQLSLPHQLALHNKEPSTDSSSSDNNHLPGGATEMCLPGTPQPLGPNHITPHPHGDYPMHMHGHHHLQSVPLFDSWDMLPDVSTAGLRSGSQTHHYHDSCNAIKGEYGEITQDMVSSRLDGLRQHLLQHGKTAGGMHLGNLDGSSSQMWNPSSDMNMLHVGTPAFNTPNHYHKSMLPYSTNSSISYQPPHGIHMSPVTTSLSYCHHRPLPPMGQVTTGICSSTPFTPSTVGNNYPQNADLESPRLSCGSHGGSPDMTNTGRSCHAEIALAQRQLELLVNLPDEHELIEQKINHNLWDM